jgi:hypothetical protein
MLAAQLMGCPRTWQFLDSVIVQPLTEKSVSGHARLWDWRSAAREILASERESEWERNFHGRC